MSFLEPDKPPPPPAYVPPPTAENSQREENQAVKAQREPRSSAATFLSLSGDTSGKSVSRRTLLGA